MNCRACGMHLPEGAAHCPRCGAATSYYSATTEASPDEPTVASSPDTAAPLPPQPHVAGSSGPLPTRAQPMRATREQLFDFHGTGDFAKLHGQGTFQGQGSHGTYATELYFDV